MKQRSRSVAPAVLLPALLLALSLLAGTAAADHGGGQDCYVCHDLSGAYVEPGTKLLNKTAMNELKGAGWTVGMPVGCVFCHRSLNSPYISNVLDSFKGTTPVASSRHPVSRNYVTDAFDNTVYWSGDNSANAQHLDCIDCHNPALTSVPNHDNAFLASATNPFGLRSVTANKGYDTFCRLCHGAGRTTFPSGKAIDKSIALVSHDNAVDNTANAIRDIDNTHLRTQDTTTAGFQCTVCHDAHEATNQHLFSDGTERGPSGLRETAIDEKGDCTTVCHYRGDAVGNYDIHGHGKATDWKGITLGQNCTFCHDANVSHNMKNFGTDNNYMRKYRFSSLDPGWLALSVYGKPQFSICARCHPDKDVHRTNAPIAGGAVGCLDCHDQHAKGSDNNVMMIPGMNQVAGSVLGVTGVGASPGSEPVLFTKSLRYPSGDNVFHFWTNVSYKGDNTSGLCDQRACHGAGDKLGFPLMPLLTFLSTTGQHSGGVFTSNDYNSDCSSCHSHTDGAGSFRASAGCIKCHGFPPPPPYENPDNVDDYYTLNEYLSPHRIHAGPKSSGYYKYECTNCHVRYTDAATHKTTPHTFKSVFFADNVKLGVAAYDNASFRCTNIYCHSNGLGATPNDNAYWYGGGGTTKVNIGCNGCHNSVMTSGLHPIHRASGYGCGTCHVYTSNDGGTALTPGTGVQYHVNFQPSVTFNPAYVTDNSPTGHYEVTGDNTCSQVTCHGGFDVVWAPGSLSCVSCHGYQSGYPVESNVYDYSYDNAAGVMSKVSPLNYSTRGHGDNTGGLPWDPASNPGSLVTGGCFTCHSNSITHDNVLNPFRFRSTVNAKAVAADNVNSMCAACHTFAGRSQEHGRVVDNALGIPGGQQNWSHEQNCVDCHDVHGTANIYMVYDNLAYQTDNTNYRSSNGYGTPLYPSLRAQVSFLGVASGSNFASTDNSAPYSHICEVCHRRTYQFQNTTVNGRSGPGPHPVRACLECHAHRNGFRGLGGSNQEQFFDNVTGASNYNDLSGHPLVVSPSSRTYPAERDCLPCHGRSPVPTPNQSNECLKCHFEFRTTGTPYHPNGLLELAVPRLVSAQYGSPVPAATDGFCLQCHGGSVDNASLNGVVPVNVIPAGEGWSTGSGHGATASLSGGTAGPAAYGCRDCHYSSVSTGTAGRDNTAPTFHASVNRRMVGNTDNTLHEYPHPSDADTRYDNTSERSRQMDWFCGARCHGSTTNGDSRDDGVVRHTWDNLAGQVKTGSQTHPSDMAPVPRARFRSPDNLPLSEYMSGALPGSGYEVCITCHNPHGGAVGLVGPGGAGLTGGAKQMMRRSFSDNASTICKECHL